MTVLPQTPSSVVIDPRQYVTMIYGEPGVGKTSWASQVPGTLFVKTEEGCKGVEVYGLSCPSWNNFIDICLACEKGVQSNWESQRKVETVVIDPIEGLYWACGDWVVAHKTFMIKGSAQSYQDIRHVPYGQGFVETNKELLRVLNKLVQLGLGLVLISHEKEREVKWGGQELPKYEPCLPPSAIDTIVGYCDAVGHFTIEEEVKKEGTEVVKREIARWQWWQPAFLRMAKHRLQGFPERLLLPIDKGYEIYRTTFEETANR